MAIKRRGYTAQRAEKISKGRHPLLDSEGNAVHVWRQIQNFPGCTRKDVEKLRCASASRLRTCVSELINAGLVYESGYTINPNNNRKTAMLFLSEGRETGVSRELVLVKLHFFENNLRQFSCVAELVEEADTAKDYHPKLIKTKEVSMYMPRSDEVTPEEANPLTMIDVTDYNVTIDNDSNPDGE